jgi:hypothetical protein
VRRRYIGHPLSAALERAAHAWRVVTKQSHERGKRGHARELAVGVDAPEVRVSAAYAVAGLRNQGSIPRLAALIATHTATRTAAYTDPFAQQAERERTEVAGAMRYLARGGGRRTERGHAPT